MYLRIKEIIKKLEKEQCDLDRNVYARVFYFITGTSIQANDFAAAADDLNLFFSYIAKA